MFGTKRNGAARRPSSEWSQIGDEALAGITIRALVEASPATMRVLAPLGIDLCCGGGHPLGEALDRHGIDRAAVLPRIRAALAAEPR